jgi:hypothetical protein
MVLRVAPSIPRAGEWFLLVAELVDGSPPEPLLITFEKHRVAVDGSGTHELCPIQPGYFAEGSLAPVELKAPDVAGTSRVQVLGEAENPPCPSDAGGPPPHSLPIKFPDLLLFTAFVQLKGDPAGEPIAKVQAAVTIQEPATTALL